MVFKKDLKDLILITTITETRTAPNQRTHDKVLHPPPCPIQTIAKFTRRPLLESYACRLVTFQSD